MQERSTPALGEAAAWYARLGADDCDKADWLAFAGWLADPAHRSAWARLRRLLNAVDARRPATRRHRSH